MFNMTGELRRHVDYIEKVLRLAIEGKLAWSRKAIQQMLAWVLPEMLSDKARGYMAKLELAPGVVGKSFKGGTTMNKSFNEFLQLVRDRKTDMLQAKYGSVWVRSALEGECGILGGYAIAEQYMPGIFSPGPTSGVFERYADTRPMDARVASMPAIRTSDTPTANQAAWWTSLDFSWEQEAAALDEEEFSLAEVQLLANALKGYMILSNEVINDSGSGPQLQEEMRKALSWQVDHVCWNGSGTGQPLGVLNAPATISVTRTADNDFQDGDVDAMAEEFVGFEGGRWFIHQTNVNKVLAFGSQYITPRPSAGPGELPVFLSGLPVSVVEQLPKRGAGSSGDVVLANLSYYLLGQHREPLVSASEHARFINDQSIYRLVWRGDGLPKLDSKVTLADTSTFVSPFVKLGAAA